MTLNALELFGESIQKTQLWLNELRDELDWDHPAGVLAGLRATLHTLRDRLSLARRHVSKGEIEDVIHLLPAEVRALWP